MNEAVVLTTQQAKQVREWLSDNGQQLISDVCLMMQTTVTRISDALSLTFEDVLSGEIDITEQKTGKRKALELHDAVIEMVARRRKEFPKDVHVFRSQRNRSMNKQKPVTREEVSRQISKAAKALGIRGTVSAHSFRKAGSMAVYAASGNDIAQAMAILNHDNLKDTKKYLKLDKVTLSKTVKGMDV